MNPLHRILNALRWRRRDDLPVRPVSVATRDLKGPEAREAMAKVAAGLRDFRANKASVGWSGSVVNERG
jgi:hypothetical protein